MITYNDLRLRELKKELTEKLHKVYVGVFDHSPRPDDSGLSNFELAIIHEYGTAHVPERSFLRRAVLAHQSEFQVLVQRLTHAVFQERLTMLEAMKQLGEWGVKKTQDTILDGIPPPLAASTVARKGHDQTLVETMRMFTAIEYRMPDE